MKRLNNIWTKLKFASIGLIIVNLILYTFHITHPNFKNGIKQVLHEIFNKNSILILYLILSLVIGFILSRIPIVTKKFNLDFIKGLIIGLLIMFSISLVYPVESIIKFRKIKVPTNNSVTTDYIEYETNDVIIYFKKKDIIYFCNILNNPYRRLNNFEHFTLDYIDTFKYFVQHSNSNIYLRSGYYYYLQDTFNIAYTFSNLSTPDTFQIIDKENIYNSYLRAIEYMLDELIKSPGYRLYDKQNSEYVEYIYYRTISDELGGVLMYCYLPDGRLFLERILMLGL